MSEPTGKLMVNTEADKFTMIYRTPLVNEVSVDSSQSPVMSWSFSGGKVKIQQIEFKLYQSIQAT